MTAVAMESIAQTFLDRHEGSGARSAHDDEQVQVERCISSAKDALARTTGALSRDALVALQRFSLQATGAREIGELIFCFVRHVFEAYPAANHLAVFLASRTEDGFEPFVTCDRKGTTTLEPLSRSVEDLLREKRKAFLFHSGDVKLHASASLKIARARTGLCAPMWNAKRLVGVVQLDRRGKLGGGFHGSDLELFAVFAHQLAALIDSRAMTEKLRLEVARLTCQPAR